MHSTVGATKTSLLWPNKKAVWSEKETFDPYRHASNSGNRSGSQKKRGDELQALLRSKGLDLDTTGVFQQYGSL